MRFHLLIPTLRLACSTALANHQAKKLSENSALAIAFLGDGTPEIIYVPNVETYQCPSTYSYAAVLLRKPLVDLTNTFASSESTHEETTERMATLLLTNLAKFVYETKPDDNRMVKLANALDGMALRGIIAGVTTTEKQTPAPASIKPCESPERN